MSHNLFPIIVGKARIRDHDNNGKFLDIDCATNTSTSISTSETKELVCGGWESLTLEKPAGTITLKIMKTKNPELIWRLLNLDVISSVTWETTITNKEVKFDKNWFIEMLERSNDENGITSIVIKSLDGVTTYQKDTDYTVEIKNKKTIIKRKWTNIAEEASVLFSWVVNQNASKEVNLKRLQRWKKKFTIELFGEDQKTGKMTTLLATPVELNSDYMLEMKDAFRDGDISWTELSFVLVDGWEITFRDENI